MIDTTRIAVSYARERGWQVFPTDPETDRLPDDWVHRATAEPQGVRELWDEVPEGNPALRCGPRSGVLVLDVDPKSGGGLLLDRLEEELGRLPDTLIARTGGGGLHLFFNWVDLDQPTLEPWGRNSGLAVRAGTADEGAYVWLPPTSRTEDDGRRYEWRNPETPVADLPDAWVRKIRGEEPEEEEEPAGEEEPGDVEAGTATEFAGTETGGDRERAAGGMPGAAADEETAVAVETGWKAPAREPTTAEAPRREETGPVWTPADLVEALREDARVERTSPMLLWDHSMTCLLGAWNSGKTTVLASDLAAVLSKTLEGGSERRILWISEMSRAETAHYAASAGLDVPELSEAEERGLLQVIGLRGTPHRSWADLEDRIDDFDPDMIYVDTVSALLDRLDPDGAPEPDDTVGWERFWDTRFADWTDRWAHDGLVAVDRSLTADPGRLAGTGGKAAGADVLLCLLPGERGHGGIREIQTVGGRGVRSGEKTYVRYLETGRYGRYVPLAPEEVREIKKRERGATLEDDAQPYFRILEAVRANPGALSSELHDLVRGRENEFRSIRDRLVEWNLIEDRSGSSSRGHSWHLVKGVEVGQARARVIEQLKAEALR